MSALCHSGHRMIAPVQARWSFPLVLLEQPRPGSVLPRGRLHLDFRDLNLDEIANGDETDQPVFVLPQA